jgi:hypothetical protein
MLGKKIIIAVINCTGECTKSQRGNCYSDNQTERKSRVKTGAEQYVKLAGGKAVFVKFITSF